MTLATVGRSRGLCSLCARNLGIEREPRGEFPAPTCKTADSNTNSYLTCCALRLLSPYLCLSCSLPPFYTH